MNIERALEIITAYGADAARWPEDERGGVLAQAGAPAVVAALADAQRLDALLAGWAHDVVPPDFDAGALVPAVAMQRPVRRWFAAGALAAVVAAAVVLVAPVQRNSAARSGLVTASAISTVTSATVEAEDGDADAFGYVFTPTADEDQLI